MRKVVLWDKTEYFIPNEKEGLLIQAMDLSRKEGTGFYLNHSGGKIWINNPKTIAIITDGGREAPEIIDHSRRISSPKLTDEQRKANIARFSKMREDWLKERARKKTAQAKERQDMLAAQSATEAAARQKVQADLDSFLEQQRKDGKVSSKEEKQ